MGNLSMEEFFMAEDNLHEGAQDILALFKTKKNNKKIIMEKFFSTESMD